MIHIAHLVHSFGTGGIENGIVNLVNRMNPGLFRHTIVCFTSVGDFRERVTVDAEFVCLNKKPGNSLRLFPILFGLFITHNVDIVHCRGWSTMAEGIVAGKIAGKIIVYGFHGKTYEDLQEEKRARTCAQSMLLKGADGVVTLIEDMKNDICRSLEVPSKQVTIIRNGVDTRFKPSNGLEARKKLGVGGGEFVVGAVGRLDPVKNYSVLLDAFQLFCKKHTNAKLVLVGDGEEFVKIKKRIENLGLVGKVVMPGKRDDLPYLLSAFDIFVQPSLYEGLSNTILEAMSMGLPIVASKVGGNPDVVTDGRNGLLFNPTNTEALACAMEQLMGDKKIRYGMAVANMEKIEQFYSIEGMINNYEQYYLDLYNRKRLCRVKFLKGT